MKFWLWRFPKTLLIHTVRQSILAGLVPLAVEIDIVATIRSLSDAESNRQPVLIADIGAENTSLAICQNQIPYFTSSIPLSGKSFTEALQKEIGVSWEKAEEHKIQIRPWENG